jgi:hypothetical protein
MPTAESSPGPRARRAYRLPEHGPLPDLPLYERLIEDGLAAADRRYSAVDHITARRLAIWLAARPQDRDFARGLVHFAETGGISQGLKTHLRVHVRTPGYPDQLQAARLLRYCAERGPNVEPISPDFGRTCDQIDRADVMLAALRDRARQGHAAPEQAWPETDGPQILALAGRDPDTGSRLTVPGIDRDSRSVSTSSINAEYGSIAAHAIGNLSVQAEAWTPRGVTWGGNDVSIKSKIAIPAVTLTLLGGLSAAGTLTANAATAGCAAAASASPPLSACMTFYDFGFGTNFALANDNGQVELDIAAAIPGEDFEMLLQGTVSDFVSAGLMDPGLDALYANLPVYEIEWAPNGQPSGLCVGVSGTSGNNTPAVFLECGQSVATTWIFYPEFPGDALLSGATDHDFKHPPALTTSGNLVYTDSLKANKLTDQLWGEITGAQCLGTAIPSGEVVTTLYTTAGCGSSSYNTEGLSPIAAGVAMCNQAMFTPSGWVVTAIYNSGTCGPNEEFGNTYVLATPSAGLAICSQATSTPSGYVVTAVYNSGTCDQNEESGNTYVIQLPSNGLAVCDVSSIPAGWHVTTVYNTNSCGQFIGNGGGNTEVIES